MERFSGRNVLITGGGSGIGQATVYRILAEGGKIVAVDVNEDGLKKTLDRATAEGTADRLTVQVLDIADEAAVVAGVAEAIAGLGGLDVLVNAAASSAPRTPTRPAWSSGTGSSR